MQRPLEDVLGCIGGIAEIVGRHAPGERELGLTLTRALAEELAQWVPARRVELHIAGREPGALVARRVDQYDTWDMFEGSGDASALAAVDARLEARADGEGARWLATAPLPQIGALRVWLADDAGPGRAWWREPQLWRCVARVLAPALRARRVVRRVAALSRRAHQGNRELRGRIEMLEESGAPAARSAAMRRALARAERVAGFDTTVLLVGESGTGKEVLARWLHRRSPRASRPLLQVNCGALPGELIESALFGHERGAFTGASRLHHGLFERADRGTLLLDEVAELPAAAQVKLLRVLQEGRFERLGGERARSVDVRVLAATHRSLERLVEQGRFREDLYYRLAVFPIELPPLRARQDDLPALVAALLQELCARMGRPPPAVPERAMQRLRAHSWPGNVRELRNVLEQALVMSRGPSLVLPETLTRRGRGAPAPAASRGETSAETFEEGARRCIEAALTVCGGKIYGPGGAAERLALKPGTLQSKMRKLGIERRAFVRG